MIFLRNILICLIFVSSFQVNSFEQGYLYRPPSLKIANTNDLAVFVDIKEAHYSINYNEVTKKAYVKSQIKFENFSSGRPIFDLIPNPTYVSVDNSTSTMPILSLPENVSRVRYVDQYLESGLHMLVIEHELTENVSWRTDGLRSAFWTSDLDDRSFLEQYLPSNLEYDQYKMTFDVKVTNGQTQYEIFTNGRVSKTQGSDNEFKIEFPDVYNTSSVYYHIVPTGAFKKSEGVFKSLSGKEIPVIAYSSSDSKPYFDKALRVLAELEQDYGAWPHPKVVIYGAGSGGMEYCGATITDLSALGHELTHSYFARGVMPARGNAGWMDEAMASWRDANYPEVNEVQLRRTRMAAHSDYTRITDRAAYSSGRDFLGHLNKKFKDRGGLKPFMAKFFQKEQFKPFITEDFERSLKEYFKEDVGPLFDKYVYARGLVCEESCAQKSNFKSREKNPYHPQLSKEQLLELL